MQLSYAENVWKKWCRNYKIVMKYCNLNEKQIEERLDHKRLRVTTVKYLSANRKYRYEFDEPKKTTQ